MKLKKWDREMRMPRNFNILSVIAVCSVMILGSTIAVTQEQPDQGAKALLARQGFMKLIVWEAGPLFGMAKGKMAYDAEAAAAHAAELSALSQYSFSKLFLPGTSNADRPGKSCAVPDIWDDTAKFEQAFKDFQTAAAAVGDVASNGQPALAAAVGEMGKSCGGCHKPFRVKDTSQKSGFCIPDS